VDSSKIDGSIELGFFFFKVHNGTNNVFTERKIEKVAQKIEKFMKTESTFSNGIFQFLYELATICLYLLTFDVYAKY
jgi:hypothetical protein